MERTFINKNIDEELTTMRKGGSIDKTPVTWRRYA